MGSGTLFVVATPIGNLDDLSPRAREVLDTADIVAAEDTRVTGRLLTRFGLKCRLMALHDYNEGDVVESVLESLRAGETVALVSDAGTPLISDPGYQLVLRCHESGIQVSPVPGPSAAVAALSVSGLPTDRFAFEGFLPPRSAARIKRLESLADESRTLVFFESVHRVTESIADMMTVLGPERRAFVGRELTKRHEQCVAGALRDVHDKLEGGDIVSKGEFVIVVAGASDPQPAATDADRLLGLLIDVMPGKQAVSIASAATGIAKNELYPRMLALKGESPD